MAHLLSRRAFPRLGRWGDASLLAALGLLAAPPTLPAATPGLAAYVTLTSDYVFRGVSQSGEGPALQGGVDYQHDTGFFAGVWASRLDIDSSVPGATSRDLEVDVYAGFRRAFARHWSAEASAVRYIYPGRLAFDYDYTELSAGLSYRGMASLGVSYAGDVFGFHESALAWELSGRYPLARRLDATAGVGYFDLERAFGDAYTYWSAGLTRAIGRCDVDLLYIDTSSFASEAFGEVAGDRVVLSLSVRVR